MKKLVLLIVLVFGLQITYAQTKEISGKVTSASDGLGIPGVSVAVKGTTIGVSTNLDGSYTLQVPSNAKTLVFSFVGMTSEEVLIGGKSVINVILNSESRGLDEVVVTALGISREKKALGYAATEVGGEELNSVRETNFVNSLSGKVSGVNIKQPNTMGGSANVVIRGNSSLLGNNQALFVVDGVPIDNSQSNSDDQRYGWGGFDYGNTAADINPDDIESVSVLKGAAASALYGSRASNGVILITTKKGGDKNNKGIGVTINSGIVWSKIDKETLPKYQKEYGGGYGPYYDDPSGYFLYEDLDGDGNKDLIVPTSEDASWGAKFDPNLDVIHWDALDPLAKNYAEKRPWVYPKHTLEDFWETGVKYTNNISLSGNYQKGSFRMSYTNVDEEGIMVNSSLKRNTFNFSGSYDFTDRFTAEVSGNYVTNENVGRFGTGYDEYNPMQVFGQWFQTNIDFERLKNYKSPIDGSHRTWNYVGATDLRAFYANNPYWVRYENYNNDGRDRFYGYSKLNYKFFDWFTLTGRVANDYYNEYQEQRIAIGSAVSAELPEYRRSTRSFNEINAELLALFNADFNEISFNGLLGTSTRENKIKYLQANTVGGLAVPNFYALNNSVAPIQTNEDEIEKQVNSVFGSLSFGYRNMMYLDLTGRYDVSSTLPDDNNSYFYPSISTSFILSSMIPQLKENPSISLLKIRANYAEVGADAPVYSTKPTYHTGRPWGNLGLFSMKSTLYNPDLKPERTKSYELGLEAQFFNNRLGLDLSYYKNNSYDQILPLQISTASGYSAMYINAGEIDNKGIELALNGTPISTADFSWSINVNWFKNSNEVVSLGDDIDNILLFSAWDVSINAREDEPYGSIVGTDFIYKDGKKVVDETGFYKKTDEEKVIGNVNPDWNAGISNTFRYKRLSLKALIDIQHGGDIYSVNMKDGLATGLYEETAGLNSKDNPKRDPVDDGGGILLPNTVNEDGSPNTQYIDASAWGTAWDYQTSPTARYVYDASYVKLREVSLSYNLPAKWLENNFVQQATISFIGRNLWIIDKNTKHFDPEASLGSGNLQGIESGSYPTTRTYGVNIKLNF